MTERQYKEYSYCYSSGNALELYNIRDKSTDYLKGYSETAKDDIKSAIETRWLPAAAEEYLISPNINDYILVPVTIMPSDLPNRNRIAFPKHQLSRFNTDTGCLAYQTWRGMPCHQEHNNSDHTKAKGVIFETAFRPITNSSGNLYKVICLCGFDRSRDKVLANSILSGEANTYSMGAYVENYSCSICGSMHSDGGCGHVQHGKADYKTFNTPNGEKLAYYNAINPKGFEISSVRVPAYISAQTGREKLLRMWDD